MKKIIITGKRNIESIKKEKNTVRLTSTKWENKSYLLEKNKQQNIINQLYLGEKFEGHNNVKREIEKKLNGYKNQDIKKEKYEKKLFITYQNLIEKIVISKLVCYYCRKNCKLMYENVREEMQWTLDRIDNNIGHNTENVVICCLKCNLKRRTTNDEHFKFSKQMKIIKKYE
tara:strand:- start:317 stop:832 length:516 start_codon:yes stop_codon:yes gene_type:complete